MMPLTERVAAAMYDAPDPSDPLHVPADRWPPSHPDDVAWWMTRAQAAINTITEIRGTKKNEENN